MADKYYVTDKWGRTSVRKLTAEQAEARGARPVNPPAEASPPWPPEPIIDREVPVDEADEF